MATPPDPKAADDERKKRRLLLWFFIVVVIIILLLLTQCFRAQSPPSEPTATPTPSPPTQPVRTFREAVTEEAPVPARAPSVFAPPAPEPPPAAPMLSVMIYDGFFLRIYQSPTGLLYESTSTTEKIPWRISPH